MNGNGPLALLGEALARGTADYANLAHERTLHDQGRQEHLADVASAQGFEKDLRERGYAHEQAVYDARRFDAIQDELVRSGYLDAKDIGSPEAFALGIQKMQAERGPEYLRAVQELAQYKADIPQLLKGSNGTAKVAWIMNATPKDIDAVRSAMQRAYQDVAGTIAEQDNLRVSGDKNVAAMIQGNLGALSQLNQEQANIRAEIDRVESGVLTNTEKQRVEQAARATPMVVGLTVTDLMKPAGQAALAKAREEAAQLYRFQRVGDLQRQLATNNRQIEYTNQQIQAAQVADRTGAAAYMKFDANNQPIGTPAALGSTPKPAVAPEVATNSDAAKWLAGPSQPTKGHAPATADKTGARALGPSPVPAALGTPVNAVPPIRNVADLGDALKANVFDPIGRVLTGDSYKPRTSALDPFEYTGPSPQRLLQEYTTRLAQYADKTNPRAQWLASEIARLRSGQTGTAPSALGAGSDDAVRAEEDRILTMAPNSAAAQAIRQRRGMPPNEPAPAALGF